MSHYKLAAAIPHSVTSDKAVNDHLDALLYPYYIDNESRFYDDDVTCEAQSEWEYYQHLVKTGELLDEGYKTWQEYALKVYGWKVEHEADGDHAYMGINPTGIIDYHYDWHGDFYGHATFGDTERERMGLPELAALVRSGAYDCSDLDALIVTEDEYVEDDSGLMADKIGSLDREGSLPGYDLVAVWYHI